MGDCVYDIGGDESVDSDSIGASGSGVGGQNIYGRKSADRTEHGNDVIFFLFLATVFGNLEVWKLKK